MKSNIDKKYSYSSEAYCPENRRQDLLDKLCYGNKRIIYSMKYKYVKTNNDYYYSQGNTINLITKVSLSANCRT